MGANNRDDRDEFEDANRPPDGERDGRGRSREGAGRRDHRDRGSRGNQEPDSTAYRPPADAEQQRKGPHREQPSRAGPGTGPGTDYSIVDRLQEPTSKTFLQYNIGVFLSIGIGYSITLFLASELAADTGTFGNNAAVMGTGVALVVGLLVSPMVAALNGAVIGLRLDRDRTLASINSAIGSAVGVVVMALVLFILLAIFSPGGGGGGGDFPIGPIFGFLIGVGLTGGLATFLTKTIR